jgi:hypothetical protein
MKHAVSKTYKETGSIALSIHNLDTRWRQFVNLISEETALEAFLTM